MAIILSIVIPSHLDCSPEVGSVVGKVVGREVGNEVGNEVGGEVGGEVVEMGWKETEI